MVYARTVEDLNLTMLVSGKLWRNSMIMQDEQTGTLWSHITGEALAGPYKGSQLTMIPAVQTTWGEWLMLHPNTLLLRKSAEIRSSRYADYFADPQRTGLFRVEWLQERLPGKSLIHGLVAGPHAAAVVDSSVTTESIHNLEVGGIPVVVAKAADGGIVAFTAQAADQRLVFQRVVGKDRIQDEDTGSIWDLSTGSCLEGSFQGTTLARFVVLTTYWFAWSSFYPKTAVVD